MRTRRLACLACAAFLAFAPSCGALCAAIGGLGDAVASGAPYVPFTQIMSATAQAAPRPRSARRRRSSAIRPRSSSRPTTSRPARTRRPAPARRSSIVTAYGSPFIQPTSRSSTPRTACRSAELHDRGPADAVSRRRLGRPHRLGDRDLSRRRVRARAWRRGANIVLAVAATRTTRQNVAQLERKCCRSLSRLDRLAELRRRREAASPAIPTRRAIMDRLFLTQVLHGGTVVPPPATSAPRASRPFVASADPDGGLSGLEPVRPLRRRHDGRQPVPDGSLE